MFALEYKQLYIVPEPLTKNRICQTYRWKQIAICGQPGPLEKIKEKQENPALWRVVPLGFQKGE